MSDTITIPTPVCPVCGNIDHVEVRRSDLDRWRDGALIQQAFPEMPAEQREQLRTGLHAACWDTLFPDDDD